MKKGWVDKMFGMQNMMNAMGNGMQNVKRRFEPNQRPMGGMMGMGMNQMNRMPQFQGSMDQRMGMGNNPMQMQNSGFFSNPMMHQSAMQTPNGIGNSFGASPELMQMLMRSIGNGPMQFTGGAPDLQGGYASQIDRSYGKPMKYSFRV